MHEAGAFGLDSSEPRARHFANSRQILAITAIVLIWLVVWLPRLKGPIDLRWDASTYYVLGTALAEGKGYRLLNEPGQIHAVQYPPVLPLLVALHQRALGTTDYFKIGCALRLFYFAISGFYLVSIYLLARRHLSAVYAAFIAVMVALSFYSFLHLSNTLYAELPFALLSTLFLLNGEHTDGFHTTVTGLLGAAAWLLRTAGIALLAAWIVDSLIRRRFRQAVLRSGIAAVPVIGWLLYIGHISQTEYRHPSYSYQRAPYYYSNVSYRENSSLKEPFRPELGRKTVSDVLTTVGRNIVLIPASLAESALVPKNTASLLLRELYSAVPSMPRVGGRLCVWGLKGLLVVVGLCAIIGALMLGRRRYRLCAIYLGLVIVMIIFTPWPDQFWRYLAPVSAISLMCVIASLLVVQSQLVRRQLVSGRAARIFMGVLPLGLILILQASAAFMFLYRYQMPVTYYDSKANAETFRLLTYGDEWHALDPALEWIRRNASKTDILATTVPQLALLRAERLAVLPPMQPDTNVAQRLMEEVPISYLLIDRLTPPGITERYAAPVVAAYPRSWRLVFTSEDKVTRVYRHIP